MNKSHFFSLWFIQFSFSQQNLFLNWPPILLYMIYFPVNLNLVLSNLVYIFGEGNGTPLQYSCLKNPMDGGAWKAAVHGVAEGRTWLNDFTFIFHFHALEKEIGNPPQCSCLENPRDGGAWWAAIYGVAQSQTWLK